MISGVELGKGKRTASQVEEVASSRRGRNLEIWLDDLTTGKLIATIPVTATGGENNWKAFKKAVKNISGHHDVFIKFSAGSEQVAYIHSIRFLPAK
ncbi:MAG: Xylan 1,4-beta-xylosidase [Ferruginibacter sp.]|nr:Xylan 1,4-beta-xylosidase [Ferruginibacter sp.]